MISDTMTLLTKVQVEDKFSPFAKETLAKLIKFQKVCSILDGEANIKARNEI